MKKKALYLFIISVASVICFLSCKKENSCEGCINGVAAVVTTNHPPVAKAGTDQTITLPTNTINLDASASTDPENNITSYLWTKISGPSSFIIGNANIVQTQVADLIEGVYQFELKVIDAGGLFSKDTMQVTVNPEINNSLVDIYVAGDVNGVVVYWKNGQAIPLDNMPSYYSGMSIAVVGSDIGVAATKHELMWNDYGSKYWKNGQQVILGTYSGATSIALNGSDVYIAGWEWEGNNPSAAVAKYWKNGQPIALTNGSSDAWANSIVVDGSDIYVAGQLNALPVYWKNGQAVILTNGTIGGEATAIAVQGNDVYVAGYEGKVAKYWKNGQAISLTDGTNYASARSIAVDGNNVYVAGWEGDFYGMVGGTGSVAKYWKNGQVVSLTSGTTYAYANSIAIFGSDVYVAGTEIGGSNNYMAKYWKNGQAVLLSNGGSAKSIVVVQH